MERERNETTVDGAEKDGIRKAALFLSILDSEAADDLLARFEPDVARAIEAEARRIGSVAPEDVDAIVAEFLALSEPEAAAEQSAGRSTGRPNNAEGRGDADGRERKEETERRAAGTGRADFNGRWDVDGRGATRGGDFQPLDAIEPERLARMLTGAAKTTVAVALARLSERRRAAVVALLPAETAQGARRALGALVRTTDAARRLEDALFNGAFDDE